MLEEGPAGCRTPQEASASASSAATPSAQALPRGSAPVWEECKPQYTSLQACLCLHMFQSSTRDSFRCASYAVAHLDGRLHGAVLIASGGAASVV